MAEFERSVTVPVNADEAYRFLANPSNLPRYVATMVFARREQGQQLRVVADVEGRHEEGDARFQTDAAQRRIEWGGERGSGYRGWIQVEPMSGGSEVTIHLHVEHQDDQDDINRVLDETVGNIERLLATG